MTLDRFRSDFQKFTMALNLPSDEAWTSTVSGRIYRRLEGISKRLNQPLSIDGKGGVSELYHLGNETAKLLKHLKDSTVGEDGGTLVSYAEGWEYKRLGWWKEALDLEGRPVTFLDTPVLKLAVDAGISNPENYFVPEEVVKKYQLNPDGDRLKEIAMRDWVVRQIKELLDPLVNPAYEVKFFENDVRLFSLTNEAKKSRLNENHVYQMAKDKIKLITDELVSRYEAKSKEVY